ncbi:MAG: hypothetical protein ACXWXZ_04010 [Candidatus Binatia bacterium]
MQIKILAFLLLLISIDVYALPIWGVRLRPEHRIDATINLLKANNFKTVRSGLTSTDLTAQHDFYKKLRENGITAQLTVQPTFQNDHSCNQNYTAIHDDAYNDTITMLDAVRDVVFDFEILNEIQLRSEITAQCTWNSQQGSTACYESSTCMATAMAAANGIEEAIHNRSDANVAAGRPALRTILGLLGRDWGFINYAVAQGVAYDVIGYHLYNPNSAADTATASWYGTFTGSPGLIPMLDQFNKPVTINEFNCGELWDPFDNTLGSAILETCSAALFKHIIPIIKQTSVDIESIVFYELYDDPDAADGSAEEHAGLLFIDGKPKNLLRTIQNLMGGRTPTGN